MGENDTDNAEFNRELYKEALTKTFLNSYYSDAFALEDESKENKFKKQMRNYRYLSSISGTATLGLFTITDFKFIQERRGRLFRALWYVFGTSVALSTGLRVGKQSIDKELVSELAFQYQDTMWALNPRLKRHPGNQSNIGDPKSK